jgi:predicted DNA-binding transcriptional regulator YafY
MRRADRLFQIVQLLRGRRLTTAAQLAGQLQVSLRTIYRDVQDLSLTGVPIEGEAGVGYRLRPEFDLPPLMFSFDEIEALVVGSRMIQSWGSPGLSRAAELALAKIAAALPAARRIELERSRLYAPKFGQDRGHEKALDSLREAIVARRITRIDYIDELGRRSTRRLWPLALAFRGFPQLPARPHRCADRRRGSLRRRGRQALRGLPAPGA